MTDTKTDWSEKYTELAGEFSRAVDVAEEKSTLSEKLQALLDDAIETVWEKNIPLTVLAVGFHPYRRTGIELSETLKVHLRAGTLEGRDVTTDLVHQLANERGLEPDLDPIL